MRYEKLLLCFVFLSALCGCVIGNTFELIPHKQQPLEERTVAGSGTAKILLIDISKTIDLRDEPEVFGLRQKESVVGRVEMELDQAAKDDRVRAVVLRINSPGGTVTASDILYHRLRRFREEQNVPVYAQLMDVAASGAYYVALAADQIVAHPTTVTGSIGVVFYSVNLEGLMEKIGVANQTVKTGAKKDIGSPLRSMTEEERDLLAEVLGEMQQRFLSRVREHRPQLNDTAAAIISDGRIITAPQALSLGLVDRIGYLEDTIEQAKRRAGLEEARVIVYRRPSEVAAPVHITGTALGPTIHLLNFDLAPVLRTPQFLYLWLPQ